MPFSFTKEETQAHRAKEPDQGYIGRKSDPEFKLRQSRLMIWALLLESAVMV